MLPFLTQLYRVIDYFSDRATYVWKKSGDIFIVGAGNAFGFMLFLYSIYEVGNYDLMFISGMAYLVAMCGVFRLFDDMEWCLPALVMNGLTTALTFGIVLVFPESETRTALLWSEVIAIVITVSAIAGIFALLSKGMNSAQKLFVKRMDDDPLSGMLDDLDKSAQPQQ